MAASSQQGVTARAARSRRAARTAKAVWEFAPPEPESALWSTFGYDTICLFWNLPFREFRALSEAERQGMVRVSNRIDAMSAADKNPLLSQIRPASPRKRLAIFRRLARTLAGGLPLVATSRPAARRPRKST